MVKVDEAFELRYRSGKHEFQLLVDFDEYQKFKEKPDEMNPYDVLADHKIFKDQSKGEIASEHLLEEVFPKKEEEAIIKEMLLEGECQIPTAYYNKLREEKRQQIIRYLADNAINPQTKGKYTPSMIESAFTATKFNVNPWRGHSHQAEEVLPQLKRQMPIRLDKSIIKMSIPPQYLGSFYGSFRGHGTIQKEYFDQEGNLRLHMEVSSGVIDDVINFIKRHTNNEAEYHVAEE